jgi:Helix-loop-helix DNA-binding domain
MERSNVGYRADPTLNSSALQTASHQNLDTLSCPVAFDFSTLDRSPIEGLPNYPCMPRPPHNEQPTRLQPTQPEYSDDACESTEIEKATRPRPLRQSMSTSTSEPVPTKRSRRPRRTCTGSRGPSTDEENAKERAARAHSLVERRYREGLKNKLGQLEDALSQAKLPVSSDESPGLQECATSGSGKRKKFDVLSDAMSYIHASEVEMRHLSDEVTRLNDTVKLLEKLVRCEDCPIVKQMSMMRLQAA